MGLRLQREGRKGSGGGYSWMGPGAGRGGEGGDTGLRWLGRQGEDAATASVQGRAWSWGPLRAGGEEPYRGRPWTCPAHFLFREPLLFSLSADRCFFTFSSFLFLLCTFSYTSSLCLREGRGGQVRTVREGTGQPHPAPAAP